MQHQAVLCKIIQLIINNYPDISIKTLKISRVKSIIIEIRIELNRIQISIIAFLILLCKGEYFKDNKSLSIRIQDCFYNKQELADLIQLMIKLTQIHQIHIIIFLEFKTLMIRLLNKFHKMLFLLKLYQKLLIKILISLIVDLIKLNQIMKF